MIVLVRRLAGDVDEAFQAGRPDFYERPNEI